MAIINPDWERIVGQHRAAHPFFLDGVQHERERIIALLIDEAKQHSHPIAYYENPFGYAIALIKGENE